MTWNNAHQYLKKVYLTTKNDGFREALSVALANLRGPTREQVEKLRGEWRPTEYPFMSECEDCSRCGFRTVWGHGFKFCPACGAPMTDEAVDMIMERWKEVLVDEA